MNVESDDSDYEDLNERIPGPFDDGVPGCFVCKNCEITLTEGPNEVCEYCLIAINEEE